MNTIIIWEGGKMSRGNVGNWMIDDRRLKSKVRRRKLKEGLMLILLTMLFQPVSSLYAQEKAYLYHVNPYNFVRYDLNRMHYPGKRTAIDRFNHKMKILLSSGKGRITIVHIGGSHIQAGYFSGEMRTRFQQLNNGMNAGWGFMFPYRMAHTNSPFGYYIRYSGSWKTLRNVERSKSGPLGVGGISATTTSQKAELTILLEKENTIDYRFNKFRIYFKDTKNCYEVTVDSSLLAQRKYANDYIDFTLTRFVDSLKVTLNKKPGKQGNFSLMGITTESAPNGIMYHSLGINGAHVPAYLRCRFFEKQLAEMNPDMVILGIGINDAYGRHFSQTVFENHYAALIAEIKRAAPKAVIIFTTNNDSYLYRRYVNKNGLKVQESMFRMAKKYNAGVWDMFEVMGGLNSIVMWQKNKLSRNDKIHFTREGYLLVADLFFNALMEDFELNIK